MQNQDVPRRANHVLYLILITFLLITLRVWYLCVIKHEAFEEKARAPQRKTVIEPAIRGTIRDRYNIPLAINRIQYNATVCFDRIRDIPLVTYEKNSSQKKVKVLRRRRYIEKLSAFLAEQLDLDPIHVEDLIYSHASIFPSTPFVLKENVSETTYYKLRALEKDWVGLVMKREAKRAYPQNKVAGDLIGYMGAIDQSQYFKIAEEMEVLKTFLAKLEAGEPAILPKGFTSIQAVKTRLSELKEKSYTIHTRVGKSGIERVFDECLRGFYGKTPIEVGAKGRLIRELPGKSEAASGERLILTLSSELQAYAESLLIQNEHEREKYFPLAGKLHDQVSPPWILGGAIVAMIPQTGEVVALASYPRFDPNDFTLQNQHAIHQWLETPKHLSRIWDGKTSLKRECYSYGSGGTYEENKRLTWNVYLDSVLSLNGKVKKAIKNVETVSEAVQILRRMHALIKLSNTNQLHAIIDQLFPEVSGNRLSHLSTDQKLRIQVEERLSEESPEIMQLIKNDLDPYLADIKINDDKLLFFDLLHLLIDQKRFSDELLEAIGEDSLSSYFILCQAYANLEEAIKEQVKVVYHQRIFPLWRKQHFKTYLKEKREEEKKVKTYEHPYTDYLKEAESALFKTFWKTHRLSFFDTFIFDTVSTDPDLKAFSFHLLLKKQDLKKNSLDLYQHLACLTKRLETLSPSLARTYLQTLRCYSELSVPLFGHYFSFSKPANEQTLQDLARAFYPRYGFGFTQSYAYGSWTTIGSLLKVVVGYEALTQEYLRREKQGLSTYDLNPLTLYDETKTHQITERGIVLGRKLDGTPITRQYKGGRLPKSHISIGKVDFLTAMERSSNIYFSLLAGDVIDHPSSLFNTTKKLGFGKLSGIPLTGEISGNVPDDILYDRSGLYAFAIGQHEMVATPLQAAVMFSSIANGGEVLKPQLIALKAGITAHEKPSELFAATDYPYQNYLNSLGIHFPFFTETQKMRQESTVTPFSKEVAETLFLPKPVRSKLLESLHRVMWGEKGPGQPFRIRGLVSRPKLIRDYKSLKDQFIGKTSTAEYMYRPTLDREMPPFLCTDIWFGAMSFEESAKSGFDPESAEPELVVIVYLRYGDFGKEAVPLAAQIVKKWREIKSKSE